MKNWNLSKYFSHFAAILCNWRRVSELVNENRELRVQLAEAVRRTERDGLTGIYNRDYLMEVFEKKLSEDPQKAQRLALGFLDIDGFKEVNDTYGHQVGDIVLCAVAAKLQSIVRAGDIVARYGGDEFIFLVDLAENDDQKGVLRRIEEAMQKLDLQDFDLNGRKGPDCIKNSLGMVVVDYKKARELGINGMLDIADQMLYQAKKEGKGQLKMAYDTPEGKIVTTTYTPAIVLAQRPP